MINELRKDLDNPARPCAEAAAIDRSVNGGCLHRVLSCPGGMRIRTIHAFCEEILRRFPIEAGLPPHFAVIEEGEARALQHDALMNLLRHTSEDKALKYLVCELGGEKSF